MSESSTRTYRQTDAKQLLHDLFGCRRFGTKGLRCLRANIELEVKKDDKLVSEIVEVELWEQNPRTTSEYAKRARNGERIAWGFQNHDYKVMVSDTDGIVRL